MERRRLLRSAALTGGALALAPMLAACGFRLRGSARFAYDSLHLAATTPLAEELRLALRGNGLQVFGPKDPPERAQVVLLISGEQRARVVVSRTSNGQVRELQLQLLPPDALTKSRVGAPPDDQRAKVFTKLEGRLHSWLPPDLQRAFRDLDAPDGHLPQPGCCDRCTRWVRGTPEESARTA